MRNITTIAFLVILIFVFSSCGETKGKDGIESSGEPDFSSENNSADEEDDTNTSQSDKTDQDSIDYRQVYSERIKEYENEEEEDLEYDLIYLDEDDIPELVAGRTGYFVSVYSYFLGELYTIMDYWPYGAMGNTGYEYIPKKNLIRNYNSDLAGAILYETYYQIDENHELQFYYDEELSIWMFKDLNNNYMIDEGEYNDDTDLYYYFGDREITFEEYNSYSIPGDYEFIYGKEAASTIIARLEKS